MRTDWTDRNLLFLISLPRSGSTLLQRILAAHPAIASSMETWLLLPLFHARREGSAFAEYGHTGAARALRDYLSGLPQGEAAYREAARCYALRLYGESAGTEHRYFLEKTPRNVLVLEDLLATFPGARYLFLWRNPLATAASLIETFGKGRWNLYRHYIDLYDGLDLMTQHFDSSAENMLGLRYEDLVQAPERTLAAVGRFLGLELDATLLERFPEQRLTGRMGDPTGVREYRALSTASLDKWQRTLATPWRKAWARRYLAWIGDERLQQMGYVPQQLREAVAALPARPRQILSDPLRMGYGLLDRHLQISLIRRIHARGCSPRRLY